MRLIPGKTKVQIELFKGVSLWDVLIGGIAAAMLILVVVSSLPFKFVIAIVIFMIAAMLLLRLDTEPNYIMILNMLKHLGYNRYYERMYDDETLLNIENGNIKEKVLDEFEKEAQKRQEAEAKEDKKAEKKKKKEKIFGEIKNTESSDTPEKNGEPEMSLKEIIKLENEILKSKTSTEEEKNAVWLARAKRSAEKKEAKKNAKRESLKNKADNKTAAFMDNIIAFTGIKDDFIEYNGKYYGAVIEIDPVEFRFFSPHRRNNSIEMGVGRVLRSVHSGFAANIVKIERPIIYDSYLAKEEEKLNEIRKSYESGMMSEDELKARVDIENDRIAELKGLCSDKQVLAPFYYIVLFESDKKQLELQVRNALDSLQKGELSVRRLNTKELAVFLKYTYGLDFNERDIEKYKPEDYAKWAMPQKVQVKFRTVEINDIVTHNFKVVNYPAWVGDAWLAGVLSLPATKVVVKCSPMDRSKAIRTIDRSLQELRGQYNATGVDSKRIELETHIQTLGNLLATLQGEGEELLECNIYITAYDVQTTKLTKALTELNTLIPEISGMKKTVRRTWSESNFRLNDMFFDQMNAFIASQISAYDPEIKSGRGIPSNSLAAGYPWIYAHISDEGGFKLGSSDGIPVFIDFFRRDSERVNSNMVIIGKSGSGKSYATKSILSNLASEDAKIFILDPENEYSELAANLHGKVINVANAQYGRLNPFHIITALDDDEEGNAGGSFATHLQFLEEFYRQILPDIDKDALEYLNNLTERLYTNKGITPETDLSKLRPTDYPIFDDLYDSVLEEFERTDNEYIRSMLRLLVNYIAKFSTGGRNANIWNGPSTVTTDENFTVFNFQAMLSNRNTTIANAQMLLVLKYIDNEIIKNRDYNSKYHLKRKVVVVIDEAHVFIDSKFPVALDFMFQLAKRIRKYNGMQIVITQNIKDFVGSEEIARKSTAIINACQYSFIFALAPNDMHDLVKLYEKAGGINENEQEQIMQAPRGQAFTVMSANSRSTFRVEVPKNMVDMFQDRDYESKYFTGTEGAAAWEDFVSGSRSKHNENLRSNREDNLVIFEDAKTEKKSRIKFEEFTADSDEAAALEEKAKEAAEKKAAVKKASDDKVAFEESDDDFTMSDDDLDALIAKRRAEKAAIYMDATPAVSQNTVSARTQSAPLPEAAAPVIDYDAMMAELKEKLVKEVMGELSANGIAAGSAEKETTSFKETADTIKEPVDESIGYDEDDLDLFDDLTDEEDTIPDDEILDIDTEPEITKEEQELLDRKIQPDSENEDDIDYADEYDLSDVEEATDEEIDDFDFDSLFDDEDEEETADNKDADADASSIDVMSLLYDTDESEEPAKDKKAGKDSGTHISDLSEIVEVGGVADITLDDLADVVTLIRKKKRDMEE